MRIQSQYHMAARKIQSQYRAWRQDQIIRARQTIAHVLSSILPRCRLYSLQHVKIEQLMWEWNRVQVQTTAWSTPEDDLPKYALSQLRTRARWISKSQAQIQHREFLAVAHVQAQVRGRQYRFRLHQEHQAQEVLQARFSLHVRYQVQKRRRRRVLVGLVTASFYHFPPLSQYYSHIHLFIFSHFHIFTYSYIYIFIFLHIHVFIYSHNWKGTTKAMLQVKARKKEQSQWNLATWHHRHRLGQEY